MRFVPFLLLSSSSLAFQLPFKIPFFQTKDEATVLEVYSTPRIAIIGAGAGGSSAAFWISRAKQRFGVDVEIDVYDKQSYIGGRSTTVHPYNDSSLPPLELGASIFVEANKNLWRASDEFNLTRRNFEEDDSTMGVWDGEKVVVSFSSGWWDTLKIIWRYGFFSPKRTQGFVDQVIKKFVTLYSSETPRWDDVSSVASEFGWTELHSQSTSEYLEGHGVSRQYTRELVEAATRVNYGQNVDDIHALEGFCSLAANGATGIAGGNFQLFEHFIKHSGATIYLNTTVTSITPKSVNSQYWTLKSDRGSINYRAVILAAPFHQTGITLPLSVADQIPSQPYVHLHVTLLATTSPSFNPAYFGLPPSAVLPSAILTTYEGVRQGGKVPEFNSMTYHGKIREGEWAVKIFSEERVTDDWLEDVFGKTVGWVYRKEWQAYPKLPPTTSFPPVKLDRGLYYVNAFEPFISTMETETIAARNIVDLLLNEEFGSSICGARISHHNEREQTIQREGKEGFVFGWDC